MDWLSKNHVIVDCQTKKVVMETSEHRKIIFMGERKIVPTCLISATAAFHLIKKGCEAYLANMVDISKVSQGVMDVPVVKEFEDVFPEDLPGLSPHRGTDLEIETIPRVAPISIAPYRMAPLELKELKK